MNAKRMMPMVCSLAILVGLIMACWLTAKAQVSPGGGDGDQDQWPPTVSLSPNSNASQQSVGPFTQPSTQPITLGSATINASTEPSDEEATMGNGSYSCSAQLYYGSSKADNYGDPVPSGATAVVLPTTQPTSSATFTITGTFPAPGYYKVAVSGSASFTDSDGNNYSASSSQPACLYCVAITASISPSVIKTGLTKDNSISINTPFSVAVSPSDQQNSVQLNPGSEATVVSAEYPDSDTGITGTVTGATATPSNANPNTGDSTFKAQIPNGPVLASVPLIVLTPYAIKPHPTFNGVVNGQNFYPLNDTTSPKVTNLQSTQTLLGTFWGNEMQLTVVDQFGNQLDGSWDGASVDEQNSNGSWDSVNQTLKGGQYSDYVGQMVGNTWALNPSEQGEEWPFAAALPLAQNGSAPANANVEIAGVSLPHDIQGRQVSWTTPSDVIMQITWP
jgi:hypothetical protein